jgi:RNA polymerase sigma-70 factor (ECF subfamily)
MHGIDPLVRRAQAGDARALHELFLRHRTDVTRIVVRTLGPDADLEDIVQEAFIQIFRSIGRFEGNAKFTTWIYRVVTNVARMHLRSRLARPRLVLGVDGDPPGITSDTEQPDEASERMARIRALYRHLDLLSDKKRTVLVLHDFEGLSAQEIAAVVEAPVLTVRTRLFYARRELYAALGADPELADVAKTLADNGGEP